MEQLPKIIHSKNVKCTQIYSGVWRKRLITNKKNGAKNLMFSITHINPKGTPHKWHIHTGPFFDGICQNVYPKNFEEYYFVLSGIGTVFWQEGEEEKH